MHRSPFVAATLVAVFVSHAHAIQYDVNLFTPPSTNSPTQAGWVPVNETGINGVTFTPIGPVTIDDRDRSGNGGGAEANMWRDFIFANGSNALGEGLDITVSGLAPNSAYDVRLWAFDEDSNGGRSALWNGNLLTFGDSPDPATLNDYRVSFQAMSNGAGQLVLQGRVAAVNGQPHNVFVNGFGLVLVVPEPASAGLLLLAGAAMLRRRRNA